MAEHISSTSTPPKGVHLVGSVPLKDNEAVFRLAAETLGDRLHRIPDGETGVRHYWVVWQVPLFTEHPLLESVPIDPDFYSTFPVMRLRESVSPEDISFPSLGYADAALDSYKKFQQLKEDGVIPAHCRFQVSLPTPIACIGAFIAPEDQAKVEPAYQKAILRELEIIVAAIPADQLAIQWDVAVEFAIIEQIFPNGLSASFEEIVQRLVHLGNQVPPLVELGYHLCYGDVEQKHFKEPEDTTKLVRAANQIARDLSRPLNWIHLPVPQNRSDDAYFAPLKHLRLLPETELYLGLVHSHDGPEGARERIAAAQRVISNFGVATECGLGRRAPETIPALLQLHHSVSSPL